MGRDVQGPHRRQAQRYQLLPDCPTLGIHNTLILRLCFATEWALPCSYTVAVNHIASVQRFYGNVKDMVRCLSVCLFPLQAPQPSAWTSLCRELSMCMASQNTQIPSNSKPQSEWLQLICLSGNIYPMYGVWVANSN